MTVKIISNGKELSYPHLRLLTGWVLSFAVGFFLCATWIAPK